MEVSSQPDYVQNSEAVCQDFPGLHKPCGNLKILGTAISWTDSEATSLSGSDHEKVERLGASGGGMVTYRFIMALRPGCEYGFTWYQIEGPAMGDEAEVRKHGLGTLCMGIVGSTCILGRTMFF